MKIWRVIFAALVIFGAGVVTGGLTVNLRFRPPTPPSRPPASFWTPRQPTELLGRMRREVDLNPAYKGQIEQILRESEERTKRILESASEEHRKVRTSIREVLAAEQKKKFDEVFTPRVMHKPGDPRSRDDRRRPEERRNQAPPRESSTNPPRITAPEQPSK